MAGFVRTLGGALVPAKGQTLGPGETLVEIADDAIKPYVKPTLEDVIAKVYARPTNRLWPYPGDIAAAIREAFPEARL